MSKTEIRPGDRVVVKASALDAYSGLGKVLQVDRDGTALVDLYDPPRIVGKVLQVDRDGTALGDIDDRTRLAGCDESAVTPLRLPLHRLEKLLFSGAPAPTPPAPQWMVFGLGQAPPRVKHDTIESATEEAKRLAAMVPGVTFLVLQIVAGFEAKTVVEPVAL